MKLIGMILAGGLGLRLRPITFGIPKPLVAINGVPLIHGIIKNLKSYGLKEIYISTGYLSDLVKAYVCSQDFGSVVIKFVDERVRLGTAGPLKLIQLNEDKFDILLTNGDLVFDLNIDNFYENFKLLDADISIVTKTVKEQSRYGVINSDPVTGIVTSIKEKPSIYSDISCGIYLLKSDMFSLIPRNENFDMPDLIRSAIKNGFKVVCYRDISQWACIDSISDLNSASISAV